MEGLIYVMLALIVYLAPTWLTKPGRRLSVFIINGPLGWTGIGYIGALFLAARSWESRP